MKLLKFGGTSIRNAEWMNRALDIAVAQLDSAPLLVCSAMDDTTDVLLAVSRYASEGDAQEAESRIEALRQRHFEAARKLLSEQTLTECEERLSGLFTDLSSVMAGLFLLRECTKRSSDLIQSFGERLATVLLSAGARERGIPCQLLDARQFIKTSDDFSRAVPIENLTFRLIRAKVKPKAGRLLVTQGFIGSTEQGIATTLGRGGSDYSASIFGAALKAEEIQIWTDVDGIMTADPRMVPAASTVREMTYKEAAELAYFGARVVHPSTIQPAVNADIPICVRNTGNPEGQGTRIAAGVPSEGPKAVAYKQQVTVLNVSSGRMLMAYGFLRSIFEIFERHKTPVDLVATSEVSVSMTIDSRESLGEILEELERLGTVGQEKDVAIVCLVGQDLWKNSSIIARVFGNLQGIPIRMISLGSSDTNLSLVVPQESTEEAVRRLHREFFEL